MNVKEVVQKEMTKGTVTVRPGNHLFHAYALMRRAARTCCGISAVESARSTLSRRHPGSTARK